MEKVKERKYKPFIQQELADGFRYLRNHDKYKDLVPPPRSLHVDWFLSLAIGKEVAERRTRKMKLALLVGTVVREFVPDTSPERRRLGEAYRDMVMYMFRNRKKFQHLLREKEQSATEHPVEKHEQFRLV